MNRLLERHADGGSLNVVEFVCRGGGHDGSRSLSSWTAFAFPARRGKNLRFRPGSFLLPTRPLQR